MVLGHFGSRVNFFTVVCFIWNSRVLEREGSARYVHWKLILKISLMSAFYEIANQAGFFCD